MIHPEWPVPLRGLLAVHVAAGVAAFVIAPVALVTAKGGPAHRRAGRWYLWAMVAVAATAMALSLLLPIVFLAGVSVFSLYAAVAAYRVLRLKDLPTGGRPARFDYAAAVATIAASLGLVVGGVAYPAAMGVGLVTVGGRPVNIVAVVFGLIGANLGLQSLARFARPPADRMFWWCDHMKGMLASYIAAWTAFSAVTLTRHFGPSWGVWLWPTLVGVPATVLWVTYYRVRFGRRAAA